jgi:hypothetical protein
MFSFGTPAKQSEMKAVISPQTGKTVRFINSPEGAVSSPGQKTLGRSASSGKDLYANYPCKSPNARLIDIKNSTWRTKLEMSYHGRHLDNKLLYTVGPREAYVVDKLFDRDMNYLKLGELSHEGEILCQKKANREYVVDIESGYVEHPKDREGEIDEE